MKLEIESKGLDNFGEALQKKTLAGVQKDLQQKVNDIRCPEHGTAPTIAVRGTSLGDPRIEVTGACCDKLTQAVKARLNPHALRARVAATTATNYFPRARVFCPKWHFLALKPLISAVALDNSVNDC